MSWWHPTLNVLAEQLSKGCLNEMKRRIQTSNIKREKLKINEDSQRMREFFQREIKRHHKRKTKLKQRQQNIQNFSIQLKHVQTQLQRTQTELKQKEDELRRKESTFVKRERELDQKNN